MEGQWLRKPTGNTTAVFVHGVLSSGDTCWRHSNGAFWPELLISDPELASVGVYVFTYHTGFFSGSYRISDVVDALKEFLLLDGVGKSERIVFVCHSMGGIVVRKYLVERAVELVERRQKLGLFLMASPSLGSSYADWLSPLAELFGHAQGDALRFVQNNHWLTDLDKEFINLKESKKLDITGKELIEDWFIVLPALFREQIVPPFTGARYFGNPFKVPKSDHFSIAKPTDDNAVQHRMLLEFVREIVSGENSHTAKLNLIDTEVESLHYAPDRCELRFSITNFTQNPTRLRQLRLIVNDREPIKDFRIRKPGAPIIEYELHADIRTSNDVDLLAEVRAQFILKGGETDAFRLTITANEGFRYKATLACVLESLTEAGQEYGDSSDLLLTYPIRTVRGLRGGN
ncbi:lipase family alpha/beta hydrolase [Bradyrhizobium sp. CCBAU 65884]|uniref:lipase family alpha/beta hydrolase n=1 Tax=Bradyrhizobium sp. CCBAU 65884 TaxID=722477 RepID=UPI002305391E|nr:alpha/beta hydrolase [Bradyrhizobium sp. CCBAU 65884]